VLVPSHETIGWEPLKVYLVVNVYENLGRVNPSVRFMKAKDLDKDVWKSGVWVFVEQPRCCGKKKWFSKKEHCV
jgi:hypothetical protein